jgi:DNA-binding NarL/FixJ family response regulator
MTNGRDARRVGVALGRLDTLVSRGLEQVLREDRDLQVVGTGMESTALERAVAQRKARVVILDEDGVVKPSVPARLRSIRSAVGIVAIAHRPTHDLGMRLLAGGFSCIATDAAETDVLAAVRLTAEGKRLFVYLDGRTVERDQPVALRPLTSRELEVFEHLSRGHRHSEIAHALKISSETARTHSAHIRSKLGVHSNHEFIGLPVPNTAETEDG